MFQDLIHLIVVGDDSCDFFVFFTCYIFGKKISILKNSFTLLTSVQTKGCKFLFACSSCRSNVHCGTNRKPHSQVTDAV